MIEFAKSFSQTQTLEGTWGQGSMAYQKSPMSTHRELVKEIENILKTDLGFLYKLAPRESGILATSLKDLVEEKNTS